METTYTYTKENGEVEHVALERYAWGVVYKATDADLEDQRQRTIARNRVINEQIMELAKEFDAMVEEIRASLPDSATKDEIEAKMNADPELVELNRQIEELKVEKEVGQPLVKEELHQFGTDGVFHRIGEVDQDRVEMFILYRTDDPTKRIDLVVPEGAKLIHKYRNIRPYYLPDFVRIYVFGYKLGNIYHYNYILPDDRIVQGVADSTARLKSLEAAIAAEKEKLTAEGLEDEEREIIEANIARWTDEKQIPSDPAIDLTLFELNRNLEANE